MNNPDRRQHRDYAIITGSDKFVPETRTSIELLAQAREPQR